MATTEAKARFGDRGVGVDFSNLPEECIASIVSFTSPRDACRLSLVSKIFKSACDSDAVWSAFLPSNYKSVLASTSRGGCDPPRCSCPLKYFYFSLCPVLFGDRKLSFSLERCSGKKCIMLSAKALSITWGDIPVNWSWKHISNSRFADVAKLITVRWLEIRGKISSGLLSRGTHYAAYLVFKFTPSAYGFEGQSVEVGAGFVGEGGNQGRCVYLSRRNKNGFNHIRRFNHLRGVHRQRLYFDEDEHVMVEGLHGDREGGDGDFPIEKRNGWSQVELGDFFVEEGENREVEMSVLETKAGHWMGGLIVEGIEIRPKEKEEGK